MKTSMLLLWSALAVIPLAALAIALGADFVDDTYIFLRYAENVAAGHGPVFNVGERVEGYTSPLWVFSLGLIGVVTAQVEWGARVLGVLCGAGVLALTVGQLRCGTERKGCGWVFAAAGLAFSPALVFWSASGMDTPLFTLLVTATLLSALADRRDGGLSVRTMVLLILATLTRMEGVLLVAYVGAVFLWERRSIKVLFGYGAVIAVLLCARYAYYGSWLPNTFHAKVTLDLASRIRSGGSYLLEAAFCHLPWVVPCVLLGFISVRRKPQGLESCWFVGGFVALWLVYVLYAGGDNFAAYRFLLPVVPTMMLVVGWVADAFHEAAGRRSALPLAALFLGLVGSNVILYRTEAPKHFGDILLARAWVKTGRWLAESTPPDSLLATPVPGAIAYGSKRSVIDMLGLTDRTVGTEGNVYRPAVHGHSRYHTDYLFRRDPDYVVYLTSGRYETPRYADATAICRRYAYALYDFVTDPRCARRYEYTTATLPDGTVVEMQCKKPRIAAIRKPR